MELALKENFLKMDELLMKPEFRKELLSMKDNEQEGGIDESNAGCTANVCLIYKGEIFVANAGDSRCVVCSKGIFSIKILKGKAIDMSVDHKPDNELEKQRILKAGGFVNEGRINNNLNLSRAIGDLEYKGNKSLAFDKQLIIAVPEIKRRKLIPDDEFIILGCDGIWEMMSNQEIVNFVREKMKTSPLKNTIESLLDKILAPETSTGIGCDNMSAIIVSLNK